MKPPSIFSSLALPPISSSSALLLDVGELVRQSPWGLAVMALLGLSGCVPADRGWVRGELALVQLQVAELRDRIASLEEQLGHLNPKVDRILAQMEQWWPPSIVPDQHPADTRFTSPLPFPSPIPGNPPVGASLDLTITGRAPPLRPFEP